MTEWARRSVNFARVPNYDTPIKGPYDPGYMPYWVDVADCLTDRTIREVTILKCARAGGTENVLLNAIRHSVAVNPQPSLYVTGDQLSAERFMESRIKRGLRCAVDCRAELNKARQTQHDIGFPSMDFRVTWPGAKQAFKQDGWALILCDEFSTWPSFSGDMARKRGDSYPFPHIVFNSSPDPQSKRPSDEDPVFVEYEAGDMRRWYMRDDSGAEFCFEMGREDTAHGLKWDRAAKRADGSWDLQMVADTAYYITPSGQRIDNADRMRFVRSGYWKATNSKAPPSRRSYHVNAFMVPFRSGDFGSIAAAFVEANRRGQEALRTFVYEYLAEKFYGEKKAVQDSAIGDRAGKHERGHRVSKVDPAYKGKQCACVLSVDVQKDTFWWVVREWFVGGDSFLVDYGHAVTWGDIEGLVSQYGVQRGYVDNSYELRRMEVFEACIRMGLYPCFGRDSLERDYMQRIVDPFEGSSREGATKIRTYTHNPNILKHVLMSMVNGVDANWRTFKDVPLDYIAQMSSEECIDGAWQKRKGYPHNHLWDCEVLQVLASRLIFGINA